MAQYDWESGTAVLGGLIIYILELFLSRNHTQSFSRDQFSHTVVEKYLSLQFQGVIFGVK